MQIQPQINPHRYSGQFKIEELDDAQVPNERGAELGTPERERITLTTVMIAAVALLAVAVIWSAGIYHHKIGTTPTDSEINIASPATSAQ
jgi:hypothetical protein